MDAVYRSDSRRVLATLIRLLGDFDLAEEALHDAFAAGARALAARRRAGQSARLAGLRRAVQGDRRHAAAGPLRRVARRASPSGSRRDRTSHGRLDDDGVEDDRLRLIFTCCHPALPPDAQVALTLREVCGLTTEEIARAFLTGPPTRGAADRPRQGQDPRRRHPLPGARARRSARPARHACCTWSTSSSTRATPPRPARPLTRHDLSGEAIRLGRLLVELLPEPEAMGLLALMLLHESRRAARASADRRAGPAGRPGPLAAGTATQIDEGHGAGRAGARARAGSAPTPSRPRSRRSTPRRRAAAATDWAQIVGLYDVLLRSDPSPVVELNRAAAVAMRDGPAAGLALIDAMLARGELADYHLAHSARADSAPAARPDGRGTRLVRASAGARPAGAGTAVPRTAPRRGIEGRDSGAAGPHRGRGARRGRLVPARRQQAVAAARFRAAGPPRSRRPSRRGSRRSSSCWGTRRSGWRPRSPGWRWRRSSTRRIARECTGPCRPASRRPRRLRRGGRAAGRYAARDRGHDSRAGRAVSPGSGAAGPLAVWRGAGASDPVCAVVVSGARPGRRGRRARGRPRASERRRRRFVGPRRPAGG